MNRQVETCLVFPRLICKSNLGAGVPEFSGHPIKHTVLKFLVQRFPSLQPLKLYEDLPGYLMLSILTRESLHPDMLLSIEDKCLYSIELTVGFETNLKRNAG